MACDVDDLIDDACVSGIYELKDEIQLLQAIAQLLCNQLS